MILNQRFQKLWNGTAETMNKISSDVTIIGDVLLGIDNVIESGAILIGPLTIGNGNYIGNYAVIGGSPQDEQVNLDQMKIRFDGNGSNSNRITIGNNNVFREFTSVHAGLTTQTRIENNCYFMTYSHIAHDCFIQDKVKMANSVQLAGYTTLMKGAYLGLGALVHQFTVVGHYSMVGMGAVVQRSIFPFGLSVGNPAQTHKLNQVAMDKLAIESDSWQTTYLQNPIATSLPITTTGLPELDSASLNKRPFSILIGSISKNSSVEGFIRIEFTVFDSYFTLSFLAKKLKEILSMLGIFFFKNSNSS